MKDRPAGARKLASKFLEVSRILWSIDTGFNKARREESYEMIQAKDVRASVFLPGDDGRAQLAAAADDTRLRVAGRPAGEGRRRLSTDQVNVPAKGWVEDDVGRDDYWRAALQDLERDTM